MMSSGSEHNDQTRPSDDGVDRRELFDLTLDAVKRAPDIRAERVAALRQRIQAGDYYVPDDLLATKILEFCA